VGGGGGGGGGDDSESEGEGEGGSGGEGGMDGVSGFRFVFRFVLTDMFRTRIAVLVNSEHQVAYTT